MAHKALPSMLLAAALTASAPGWPQQNIPAPRDLPYPGLIKLQVDATDLDHRVFRVLQQLPVRPGRLSLLLPRLLTGTHGPYGQVERLAGLKVMAAADPLPWVRDTVDLHAFHVDVRAGAIELELQFQHLSPVDKNSGRVVMTRGMLNLQWHNLLLYPAGHHGSAIQVQPGVTLPAGRKQASALQVARADAARIEFAPVSLGTLVDSPLFAGAHFRRIELDAPGAPTPVVLNLLADEAALLRHGDEQLQAHRKLVQQSDRLFRSRHFKKYDFLLALSDKLGGIGHEHQKSSENGVTPNSFKDWAKRVGDRELLPHEYGYSWNGKFRRPADLWTPTFNVRMRNSLLWMYEGQTQFWGRVLAARSGLVTAEQARWAGPGGRRLRTPRAGRAWRNLQDTTRRHDRLAQPRQRLEQLAAQRRLLRRSHAGLARRRHADPRT